jgi:Initiator Replication protein
VVRLKSSYSIRLYEWAKRWQFAAKRRIELDKLRQVLGAVELNKMGGIKKYLLVPYKNLKARAIDPAVKELNANTEVSISYAEHKDGKRVVALTFLFRQNSKNAAKLDTMHLPHDAQMELEIELGQNPVLATAETDSDREAALLEAKVQPEFGLNARQLDMVREFIEKKGIEYVREKIAVVDSEPRKNAARTFLAALKGDWKLPVKRKPPPKPKSQPSPQEPVPEISDGEWAKQRERALATFNEFKKSMRGGPKECDGWRGLKFLSMVKIGHNCGLKKRSGTGGAGEGRRATDFCVSVPNGAQMNN